MSIAQAEIAHRLHSVTAIQSEFSLWTRDPLGLSNDPLPNGADGGSGAQTSGNLLAWTQQNQVAFVPFAPLGRGYLTGTLAADGFEPGDFRATNPRFAREAFAANQRIAEVIADIAAAHEATPAQVALAWLLGHAPHVIPIPGTRSLHHLHDNLAATELVLTEEERARLDALPAPHGSRY